MQTKDTSPDCPFALTDHSTGPFIDDKGFFDVIGLLGAFSLSPKQAVVIYSTIPVADLHLNYWSYNLYLMDNYRSDQRCSPYRQVHAASILPPFNMFCFAAGCNKAINPLTAAENAVVPGSVCFYLIIVCDKTLGDKIKTRLEEEPPHPYDMMHVFEVPAGKGSQKLDPNLPNPNGLSENDAAYDFKNQRLACFLRISPRPASSVLQLQNIDRFIRQEPPFENHSEIVLLDSGNVRPFSPCPPPQMLPDFYRLPPMIAPRVDEISTGHQQEMMTLSRVFVEELRRTGFSVSNLQTRNSTLNIFGPMDRKILNTTLPYRGGFQAVQMAGNGQADNYDAQYRLSQSTCLDDSSVLVALCVNHAGLGNVIYNSINLIDTNKAFGVEAVELDSQSPELYYIVLAGRNMSLLNQTENLFRNSLESKRKHLVKKVSLHKIFVETGPSIEGSVPMCHAMLYVERSYLNTRYQSATNGKTIYSLQDLFGGNFDQLLSDRKDDQDAWDSLVNTAAPDNRTLAAPIYFRLRVGSRRLSATVFVIVVSLMVALTIIVYYFLRNPNVKVDRR